MQMSENRRQPIFKKSHVFVVTQTLTIMLLLASFNLKRQFLSSEKELYSPIEAELTDVCFTDMK
jgi:hypothetical protein